MKIGYSCNPGSTDLEGPYEEIIAQVREMALLDQLSGGRLELGVGRGNHGVEALNLNPMADPRDPEANYAVFAETLEILKRALSQETFSFHGDKYVFPTPGFTWDRAHPVEDPDYIDRDTGEVTRLSLMPRSIQQPHPPLWQMVDSTRSIEFGTRNGLGVIMWRPPVAKLKEHFAHYRETAAEAGRALRPGEGCGVMRDTFVGASMREAERLAGGFVMRSLNWSNWRGPSIYLAPGETLSPQRRAALEKKLSYDWVHPRCLLFGEPAFVVDALEELREETQLDTVLLTSDWRGMDHALRMQSLRRIGEEVLPRLRHAASPSVNTAGRRR